MAVTSIWPVKGRVDTVINYARNPEKTREENFNEQAALHAIDGAIEYVAAEMKTEQSAYVTCQRCRLEIAVEQFMTTKRWTTYVSGRQCYNVQQSCHND